MGKKKTIIIQKLEQYMKLVSSRENVDSVTILKGLLEDLDSTKKENKNYPDIDLTKLFGIEGGKETVREIFNELIEKEKGRTDVFDKEYYREVERYTQDFEFLTGDPYITFALHGYRKMPEEYLQRFNKFVNSVSLKKEGKETEEELIKRILLSNNKDDIIISCTERKILEMRLNRIKSDREEIAKKRKEERMW